MPFVTRQASPNDLSETDACGLRTQDKLLDWLIAQRKHATEAQRERRPTRAEGHL